MTRTTSCEAAEAVYRRTVVGPEAVQMGRSRDIGCDCERWPRGDEGVRPARVLRVCHVPMRAHAVEGSISGARRWRESSRSYYDSIDE